MTNVICQVYVINDLERKRLKFQGKLEVRDLSGKTVKITAIKEALEILLPIPNAQFEPEFFLGFS